MMRPARLWWQRVRLFFWGGAAVLVAAVIWSRTFWLLPVYLSQESMAPTLQPGELLLVDQRAYRKMPPRLGDIVLFPDPEGESENLLIKRVVGLPDDLLQVLPQGVLRNREPLAEWYLNDAWLHPPYFRIRVPDGYVFVMGDNRNSSEDSRDYGPVPVGALVGRAAYVLWPWNRKQVVERARPAARPRSSYLDGRTED